VYLYLEGPPAEQPSCWPAKAGRCAYTVWHEVILRPGGQHLVPPNTLGFWTTQSESPFSDALSKTPKSVVSTILTEPLAWLNYNAASGRCRRRCS